MLVSDVNNNETIHCVFRSCFILYAESEYADYGHPYFSRENPL